MAWTLLPLMLLGWTGVSLWAAHCTGLAWMQRTASDTAAAAARRALQLLVLAVLIPVPLLDELVAQSQFEALCRDRLGVRVQWPAGASSVPPLRRDVSDPEPVDGLLVPVSRQEHRYTDPVTQQVLLRFSTYEARGGKLARLAGHGEPLLFEGHCGPSQPQALLAGAAARAEQPQAEPGPLSSP